MQPQDYANAVVQTVREPMLVLDGDLRVQLANRSFLRTFHVTPEQTQGQLIYKLGNGQWDIPALRKLLEDILPQNSHFDDFEVEHEFPTIGRRSMLLNARRLTDDGNKSQLILLAIEDVTERRRAELDLAHQRAWFQTTLASIGDAVIATDVDARVTYINPTAEAMTGWTANDAVGKPLHEVFNIVNEATRKLVESKAIRMGAIVGLANHTVLIAKDGSELPIDDSAAPIRDQEGKVIGVVMVFHDITERRKAERLMEISEIRYRRLFEAAHDGILIVDVNSRKITHVNPYLTGLLGYPPEHFIGKELWEIGVLRDKQHSQRAMQELHETGSIRYEDLPLEDRNGRKHPVEMVANIYREDHQPVIQCNIRDVSERKRFEREREAHLANEQASRLEAEAANRTKDVFLATLSHELRTPLNAILGWAQVLNMGQASPEDMREGIEVIEHSARAQAKLIEDVLDVSRIVSGKIRLEIRRCDLAATIAAALDAVRPAAHAKQIALVTEIDPSAPAVSCDPTRMQQVFWNLLSNAVKFTPKGGKVGVRLARERSGAVVEISDSGQGISAEFLPHVFERFRQADDSTKRKFGGLGLGLSIVRHLVELHGGTVAAHSDGMGRGSTFVVRLPIRAVHVDEPQAESDTGAGEKRSVTEPAPVRLDGLHVLVVDDEPDARRLLVRVLQGAGAIATAAGSAEEALELLRKARPDVLISDLGMAGKDGYELIQEIRSAGYSARDLPAVALTAFAQKEHHRRALLAGYQVHVPKPVDAHDLIAVVGSLAGRTG